MKEQRVNELENRIETIQCEKLIQNLKKNWERQQVEISLMCN